MCATRAWMFSMLENRPLQPQFNVTQNIGDGTTHRTVPRVKGREAFTEIFSTKFKISRFILKVFVVE